MRNKKLNWNQLYYFSKVAEASSFKIAAQRLDVSPSTLSEQIKALEQSLHISLFHRDNRMLCLTIAGEQLYKKIKVLFENGQRIVDYVSPLKLGSYPIWVGIVPNSAVSTIHECISSFIEETKILNLNCINLSHQELEKKLLEGILDFGFSTQNSDFRDIDSKLIAEEQIEFYVNHQHKELRLDDCLKKLPLLICNTEDPEQSYIERMLEEIGINSIATISSDSIGLLQHLCIQGKGVGIFSKLAGHEKNTRDLFRVKNSNLPSIKKKLFLLWSPKNENLESVQAISKLWKL